MREKTLSLIVKCEECSEEFSIASDEGRVIHKRGFLVEGQTVYLTYYDCPKCGRRHFVQIDDNKSLEMMDVNKGQFVHNAALKTRGQKLRKKKIDQYKSTQKQLEKYRFGLMEKYTGKTIHDMDMDADIELRFSV